MTRSLVLLLLALASSCAGSRRSDGPAPPPVPETNGREAAAGANDSQEGRPGDGTASVDEEPADPLAGISGAKDVTFDGEEPLLLWAKGDQLRVAEHELACLAEDNALSDPGRADARLENVAEDQGVKLGRLRVVRIERPLDGEAHRPRLCRPVTPDAALYAPLFRVREPASTWRLQDVGAGTKKTLASLLESTRAQGQQPASVPRAVVVRGQVRAVALPVR